MTHISIPAACDFYHDIIKIAMLNSRVSLMLRRSFSSLTADGSFLLQKAKYNVTVIGGGNAAHVLAGYAGSMPNVDVSLLNTVQHENKIFEDNISKSIRVTHRNGQPDVIGMFESLQADSATLLFTCITYIMRVASRHHQENQHLACGHHPLSRSGVAGGTSSRTRALFRTHRTSPST
jgi:hypothetical protein